MLHGARMVLYWPRECGGLFGLAANGPKDGTRLTYAVEKTSSEACRQWLAVPEKAAKEFREFPDYEG